MNWQDKKIKLYMEAGLALLLVLTLGLAGLTGLLSAGAEENTRQGVTASGEDGTEETRIQKKTGMLRAAGTVDDDTLIPAVRRRHQRMERKSRKASIRSWARAR